MQVHHLSHIDLDGYGAQLVARECFDDIVFYNANYGREMLVKIQHLLENVRKSPKSEILILITDLNLTLDEAKILQDEVNILNLSHKKVALRLFDHHISGKECAEVFGWYHLDATMCATKITLNILRKEHSEKFLGKTWLEPFSEMINSVDMWKEDGFAFDFGKVALGMIAQSKEFSRFMFEDYDRDFKLNMLLEARKYLLDSSNNLIENANVNLDNNIFLFKKTLLGGDVRTQTMEEILSLRQAAILRAHKDEYSVFYQGERGLFSYMVGGISVLANLFLKQNSEFSFFMDMSSRGSVSLRANGNFDVSLMAHKCFNGGGHRNASGGRFEGFKETFLYSDAKAQVEQLLDEVQ